MRGTLRSGCCGCCGRRSETRASERPDLVTFACTTSMGQGPQCHSARRRGLACLLQRGPMLKLRLCNMRGEGRSQSVSASRDLSCRVGVQKAVGCRCVWSAGHRLGDWLMRLFGTQHLYHEESKVVWNGNSIKGRQNVERFLTDLPASKHEPCSLDCQPVKPQGSSVSFLLPSARGCARP